MRKFNYLSLSVLLVSSPAWSMKFSAPLNQLKLPVMLSTEQPPAIKYTPAGEISVSALRMCGDGDVERFSNDHTSFDFMPHEVHEMDVVVGYWVVEEGSSGNALVPTQSNWFPVAYKKVPIAEKPAELVYEGRFLPTTHAKIATSANVMNLMKFDLMNLHTLAKSSFESKKNYRIYAGAFGCMDADGQDQIISETSSDYKYKASPVESLRSLESGLPAAVDSMFGGSMILADLLNNKKLKIDLKSNVAGRMVPSAAPTPYDYEFGNHGIDLKDEAPKLYGIYKKIMETDYPTPVPTDAAAYKAAMAGSDWYLEVSGYSAGDKINYCNSVGATSNKDAKVYQNLEAFSLNLACKNLYNVGGLDTAFKELAQPSTVPSPADFINLKKALAKRYFLAASFEAAQKDMDSKAETSRVGCFKKPGQDKLIGRLLSAYPFHFEVVGEKYVIKSHITNHLHPETLFAIRDFSRYFESDEIAIWGQVVPGQLEAQVHDLQNKSILLKLDNKTDLMKNKVEDSTFNNPININFKVRSVGGSCTFFC